MSNNTNLQKEQPLVSILMPAYNAGPFIFKTIQSIVNQTYQNWELLICNDGSGDSTLSEIKKINDPRITLFNQEQNQGVVKSRNLLFTAAKGDYITFQDADDLSMPTRIEKQVNFLNQNRDYAGVGVNYVKIDLEDNKIGEMVYPSEYSQIQKYAGQWVPFCVAGVMIRKKILLQYGDNNYFFEHIGGEDLYWVGRISLKEKMSNLNEFLYSYRLNPNSITEQIGSVKMHVVAEIINILHREELASSQGYKILRSLEELRAEAMINLISQQNKTIEDLNSQIKTILNSTTFKMAKRIRQFLLLK